MKAHILWLLTLAIQPVTAQVKFENLNDFLVHVSENNPSLAAEQLNTQVAEQRLISARALLLPQIKAFGTFDNNISLPVQLVPAEFLDGPQGQFAEVQFGTRYNSSYGVEASLPLVNVANWKAINAAHLGAEAAAFQQQDRALTLREQSAAAYYMALLSMEAVKLNEFLLISTDSLLQAASTRFENGLIEQLEFNRIRALHLESENQLFKSKALLYENTNTLKTLANIKETDTITLTEQIGDVKVNEEEANVLGVEKLPAYRALTYRRQQSLAELSRQRARVLPEISLYGRYVNQSFSNELEVFSNDLKWYPIGVVGVRAEWNLFTGFNRKSSIKQASLQHQIAERELEAYSLSADKENNDLVKNFQTQTETLKKSAEHFKLNRENYQIAGIKYDQGVYSIDQYVNIYQELIRSQNQYLSNLANYLVYYSMIQSRNKFNN